MLRERGRKVIRPSDGMTGIVLMNASGQEWDKSNPLEVKVVSVPEKDRCAVAWEDGTVTDQLGSAVNYAA